MSYDDHPGENPHRDVGPNHGEDDAVNACHWLCSGVEVHINLRKVQRNIDTNESNMCPAGPSRSLPCGEHTLSERNENIGYLTGIEWV